MDARGSVAAMMGGVWQWLRVRPMTVATVLATVAVMIMISVDSLAALSAQQPWIGRAIDLSQRFNIVTLGGLHGYLIWYWFAEFNEPSAGLVPWSMPWMLKRAMMLATITGHAIAWSMLVRP